MNEHAKSKKFQPVPQSVTTGPIAGSHKIYAAPKSHPDMRVPLREILLSDPLEPPVRVYDPSGPYTETDARIDLAAGLPPVRESLDRGARLRHCRRARGEAGRQRQCLEPTDWRRIVRPRAFCAPVVRARWSRNMNSRGRASSRRK